MEWLHEVGLSTRRSLARAAKHTGGMLEHVGTAVDTVAHTADALLPPRLGEVHSEVRPIESEHTGGPRHTGPPRVNLPHDCSAATRHRGAASAVPTSSLHGALSPLRPTRSRRAAEEAGADDVVYADADECIVGQDDEAAPMSRGLLGLGMHKDAR